MNRYRNQSTSRTAPTDALNQKLREIVRLAEAGQLEAALEKCTSSDIPAMELRNARAVCLMRLGRSEEALTLYRGFVLHPGCTWLKSDLPAYIAANFATTILLCGRPLGCEAVLSEIADQEHPSVRRLRTVLQQWRSSLPFVARLKRLLGLEPDVPVPLDFSPGEFIDPMTRPSTTVDSMTSSPPPSATQNA